MTPQGWESPETFHAPESAPGYGSAAGTAEYALRPLSTGEVLDRTFSVYRARFWLFAGLASLDGAFSLVLNAVQLLVHHFMLVHHGFRIAAIEAQVSTLVTMLLMLPVSAVVYAASVYALCEMYLGRGTTAQAALQATVGRWARYVGIGLWQGWSAVWLWAILVVPGVVLMAVGARGGVGLVAAGVVLVFAGSAGGIVYGVIAYIRNSLGVPAALMEGTGVRASMRRSKTLAAGTKGRIFLVLLIAVALYFVFGAIDAPMLFFIARAPLQEHVIAQAAVLLIGFVGHTLVSPVALIGLTLVYFDQRVRMEAFDLVMLMGGPGTGSAPQPAEAWTPAAVVAAPGVEGPSVVSPEGLEGGGGEGESMGSDGQVKAQHGGWVKREVGRRLAVAGMVLALGIVPGARAAGLKDVSADGFRGDVARLQGLVAQCAGAASGCAGDAVGDDVRVGDVDKGGFEEHWDWLRSALKDAKSAKDGERTRGMRLAAARLQEMAKDSAAGGAGPTGFARERSVANAVLAQPQFQAAVGLTWWDRLKMKVAEWLQRMFAGLVEVGTAAPWLGTLLEWLCFAGAGVGLLFFLLRNVARQRLRVTLGGEALQKSAWESEADDWAKRAAEHADAGAWREAVHCLYWAAIVLLESRRAWRHNPTRTPREYVRLLKPGSAQREGLRRLTQIFEQVWYGLREAEANEYAEARGLYERLVAGAAEGASDASAALAAGGAA